MEAGPVLRSRPRFFSAVFSRKETLSLGKLALASHAVCRVGFGVRRSSPLWIFFFLECGDRRRFGFFLECGDRRRFGVFFFLFTPTCREKKKIESGDDRRTPKKKK